MIEKDIQKILAEQREKSDIFKKTEHEIAMTINNRLKGKDTHQKKSDTMLEKYKDPEYRAQHQALLQEVAQTQEWKEAHAEGMKKREENGWEEKNLKGREKTLKPLRAGEHGYFPSKKTAVEGMTADGVVNAAGKLSVWLDKKHSKNRADEYYYITQEEYLKIKETKNE
jgi:hypothetical protein